MTTFVDVFTLYLNACLQDDTLSIQKYYQQCLKLFDIKLPITIKNNLFFSLLNGTRMYETPYFKEYIQVLSSFHDKKNLLEQLFSHEQAESFHRRVHDYLPLVISKEDALQWGKNMPKIEHINRHITALFGQILYAHYNIPLDERMMYGTDFWIHPDAQSCISEYYFSSHIDNFADFIPLYPYQSFDKTYRGYRRQWEISPDRETSAQRFILPDLSAQDSHQVRMLNTIANIFLVHVVDLDITSLKSSITSLSWDNYTLALEYLIIPQDITLMYLDFWENGLFPREVTLAYAYHHFDYHKNISQDIAEEIIML